MKYKPKKRKKIFRGRTLAYQRFNSNILQTEELLKVGLSGLTGKIGKIEELLKDYKKARGIPGPTPKYYKPRIRRAQKGGKEFLKIDTRSAFLMRGILESSRNFHQKLRFHLYYILAVAVWGSFETYIGMLFQELFRRKPQMLKSNEQISFREIINNRSRIIDCLTEKQLDKIGHFTEVEILHYLDDKMNFKFSVSSQKKLEKYYLVRNIIAHNSGIVRKDLKSRLPTNLRVRNNKIRITKGFLETMIHIIQRSAKQIEKHVIKKYF